MELLSRPAILPPPEMELVFSRLEAAGRLQSIPATGTPSEHDLFLAASTVFLVSAGADRAREVLPTVLGDRDLEMLIAWLWCKRWRSSQAEAWKSPRIM